jgi:hypothetical protein
MNKGFNNIEYTKTSKNKKRLKPSTMDNTMQHPVIYSSNYNSNSGSSSSSNSSRYDTFNVYHDKNKDIYDDDSISIIDNSILRDLCPYPNSTTNSTDSYNNSNHHHTSSSSTTTTTSDLNNYDIGKWGEALVYQYLLMTRGGSREEGVSGEEKKDTNNSNKISKLCSCSSNNNNNTSNSCDVIIHWLNEGIESRAGYDITITNNQLQHSKDYRTYIEVKSTRYINKHSFEISLWEWQFLNSPSQV